MFVSWFCKCVLYVCTVCMYLHMYTSSNINKFFKFISQMYVCVVGRCIRCCPLRIRTTSQTSYKVRVSPTCLLEGIFLN